MEMRQPALSGPENIARPASSVHNNKEFGIRCATIGLFSPLDRHTPSRLVYVQIQPKPILSLAPVLSPPFQVAVRPKWTCPERIRRCVLLRKIMCNFDRISLHTHPHCPIAIAKGWGGCAWTCAFLSHRGLERRAGLGR